MLAYIQSHMVLVVPIFVLISAILSALAAFFVAIGDKAPSWIGTALGWIGTILHVLNGNVKAAADSQK